MHDPAASWLLTAQPSTPASRAWLILTIEPFGLFAFLVLLVFMQTASEGTLLSFFTVYLDTQLGVPTAQIGTIIGSGQLLSIVGALTVPRLMRRFDTPCMLT